MSWVDCTILALVVIVAAIQAKRGFLQGLFDVVAGIAALVLAKQLGVRIPRISEFAGFLLVFTASFVLLIVASRALYTATNFTMEAFDPILGAFFGVVLACTLGHALTTGLTLANNNTRPSSVERSIIAREIDGMYLYHRLMGTVDEPTETRTRVDDIREEM